MDEKTITVTVAKGGVRIDAVGLKIHEIVGYLELAKHSVVMDSTVQSKTIAPPDTAEE